MATEIQTERGIVRVPTGTWTVDRAHSSIEFRVKHMMVSTVRGRFTEFEGTIRAAPDYHDSRVWGTIESASIDTNEPRRDEHLRSPDFFDVAGYPWLRFTSKRVETDKGAIVRVVGDLNIHGNSREVTLEVEDLGRAKDPWGNQRAAFTASTTINRKDFGLHWNQTLEAGGVLVGEKVEISLDVQAVLAAAATKAA
jgi:polyisoprenoid-binding protein YceI